MKERPGVSQYRMLCIDELSFLQSLASTLEPHNLSLNLIKACDGNRDLEFFLY